MPFGGKDDMGGGLDPFVVVGETGLGADGSDDGVASDLGLSAAFEDAIQGEAKVFAAQREEAEGVGMSVKGSFRDFIFSGDGPGAAPLQEVLVDRFAIGMAADLAFATVAFSGGLVKIGVSRRGLAASMAT